MKSSTSIKPSQIQRKWHVVDVKDQTLGRISTQIASLLIGKSKPYYVPHQDTGDYVVVINAGLVKTTGKKTTQKIYYHHSGYPGGMKTRTLGQQMAKQPVKVLEHAIKGMVPKTRLGKQIFAKLYVFEGAKHPYESKLTNNNKVNEEKK